MIEWAVRLALFALAVTASGWRALGWRLVIAAGLFLGVFLWVTGGRLSTVVPTGDADIAAGLVIYYAILWIPGGFLARALSLFARRWGHRRPWSLWIEGAAFFGYPVLTQWALQSA